MNKRIDDDLLILCPECENNEFFIDKELLAHCVKCGCIMKQASPIPWIVSHGEVWEKQDKRRKALMRRGEFLWNSDIEILYLFSNMDDIMEEISALPPEELFEMIQEILEVLNRPHRVEDEYRKEYVVPPEQWRPLKKGVFSCGK